MEAAPCSYCAGLISSCLQIQDTFSKMFALYFIILLNQFTLNQFTSVVMRDVPAQICTTCGEEYVDAATGKRLSQIAETAVNEGVQVDVRRYKAA
ncbi:MAG TPA: hypothetical protein DCK85_05410 [Ktedonobacter sp.]|jgi:hypothetical protein|nr:hypothetical protein [Ktedonobacter sp.]